MHGPDRAPAVTVASAADSTARINRQLKPNMWMEQSECADDILDCSHLGGIRLQKLQASRYVGEQVFDLERDAGQQGTRAVLNHIAGAHADARARAAALDIRNRCDAGQCFAAESQRGDPVEVGQVGDLARGVPHERHRQVLGRDAFAIVADSDRDLACPTHIDGYPPGVRVQRVLDQLLDDRRGPLDHLAGSDGVGDLRRQQMDRAHWLNRDRSS